MLVVNYDAYVLCMCPTDEFFKSKVLLHRAILDREGKIAEAVTDFRKSVVYIVESLENLATKSTMFAAQTKNFQMV
jgi:hypothetical protein